MKIKVNMKDESTIEVNTKDFSIELMKNISEILSNNSNNIFFNGDFDKKVIIMKDMIKTIEIEEKQ